MAGVRLELLGPAEILRDGRVVTGVGRKAMGLLAYLAMPKGRPHNRDELATLLWSDRFDEQARQSLRQTLSTLRKSVDDVIVTSDQSVAVAADSVESDVEEFETLAASGDLRALHQASVIYRGEFLEGFQRASPAFDDWVQAERRRLREKLLEVLEAIVRLELAAGNREQALAAARRLVSEEPAHEAGHRTIMQILAQQGQRAAALRQFENCRASLRRHLDAEPETETVELAARIRAASESPHVEPETQAAPRVLSRALRRRPLRRLIVSGAALIATLGLATLYFALRPATTRQGADEQLCGSSATTALHAPAVVVLPFEAEGEAARLADTLVDRIGDTFSAVPRLSVVMGPPRGHPDMNRPRRDLAASLGVSHLLDGAVRTEGRELSVSIRLLDGASGEVMWSTLRTYDSRTFDPLLVRDEIALEVVRATQRALTEGDQALHFHPYETTSLRVLEHVLAGSEHVSRLSRGESLRARTQFEAALAIDPRDPPANVGVALTYTTDVMFGWSEAPEADLERAERYLDAAEQSDPDYFYVQSVRGMIALLRGDHEAAVARGERALQLSGSGADAMALHALTLSYTGDMEQSLSLAQSAMRLRPYAHPDWYKWILARALRLNGDPQTAIACLPPAPPQEAIPAVMVERALALSQARGAGAGRALMDAASHQSGLTAERFCAHPPYASEALTEQCVAAMRDAGAASTADN
jgi:DNA-binding SARP family transcriptional activator